MMAGCLGLWGTVAQILAKALVVGVLAGQNGRRRVLERTFGNWGRAVKYGSADAILIGISWGWIFDQSVVGRVIWIGGVLGCTWCILYRPGTRAAKLAAEREAAST